MSDLQFEKLLTPGEVAKALHVEPKTVARWAREGKIPYITTPGGHRRYSQRAVVEMLQEKRSSPSA